MASFKKNATPRTSRSPPPQKRFTHAQKRFIHAAEEHEVDYFPFTLSWRTIAPDDPEDHTSGCSCCEQLEEYRFADDTRQTTPTCNGGSKLKYPLHVL